MVAIGWKFHLIYLGTRRTIVVVSEEGPRLLVLLALASSLASRIGHEVLECGPLFRLIQGFLLQKISFAGFGPILSFYTGS